MSNEPVPAAIAACPVIEQLTGERDTNRAGLKALYQEGAGR